MYDIIMPHHRPFFREDILTCHMGKAQVQIIKLMMAEFNSAAPILGSFMLLFYCEPLFDFVTFILFSVCSS